MVFLESASKPANCTDFAEYRARHTLAGWVIIHCEGEICESAGSDQCTTRRKQVSMTTTQDVSTALVVCTRVGDQQGRQAVAWGLRGYDGRGVLADGSIIVRQCAG